VLAANILIAFVKLLQKCCSTSRQWRSWRAVCTRVKRVTVSWLSGLQLCFQFSCKQQKLADNQCGNSLFKNNSSATCYYTLYVCLGMTIVMCSTLGHCNEVIRYVCAMFRHAEKSVPTPGAV
jgi:hypothetical protein